jgi:tRNA 2-thiouridine synthesizing protein D
MKERYCCHSTDSSRIPMPFMAAMSEEENHLLTKEVVAALIAEAERNGGKLDWVNCGLCVDERGAGEAIDGIKRGSPADFWKMAEASDNTLVIGTR